MTEFERTKRLEAEARRRAEQEAKENLHKWNGSRALILAVERAKLGLPLSLEEKALLQASKVTVSYSLAEIEAARNEALSSNIRGQSDSTSFPSSSTTTSRGPSSVATPSIEAPSLQKTPINQSESDLIREMIAREAKNLLKLVQTLLLTSSTCITLGDLSSEISTKTGRKWGHDFEPRHGPLVQFLRSEGAKALGISVHHNKFVSLPHNAHTVPETSITQPQMQQMHPLATLKGEDNVTPTSGQRDALVPYSQELYALAPASETLPMKGAYSHAYEELANSLVNTRTSTHLGPTNQQMVREQPQQQQQRQGHSINYSVVFDPFEISQQQYELQQFQQQQLQQQQEASVSTTERNQYVSASTRDSAHHASSQEFTVTMVSDYLPQTHGSRKQVPTSAQPSYAITTTNAPTLSHDVKGRTTTSYLVNQTTQDVNISGAHTKMIRGGPGSTGSAALPSFSQFNGSGYNIGSGGAIDEAVSHGGGGSSTSRALAPVRIARPGYQHSSAAPPTMSTSTTTTQSNTQTNSSFSSYHASMRPGHTTSSDTDDDAQYAQALAASFAAEDAENEKLAQLALAPTSFKPSTTTNTLSTTSHVGYPQLEDNVTWADFNVLFRPMLNRGFTLVKHGRSGYPKRRHFWFNVSLTKLFWDTSRFLDVLANGDRHIDLRHVIALYDGIQTDLLRRKLAIGEIALDQKNTFFSLVTTTRSYDFQASTPAQQKLLVRALNFLLKQLKQGINGLNYNQPMHGRAYNR
jgi:hypothetical protein